MSQLSDYVTHSVE